MAYEGGEGGKGRRGGERGREKLANIFTAARVFQRPIFLEGRRGVKCVCLKERKTCMMYGCIWPGSTDTRSDENISFAYSDRKI